MSEMSNNEAQASVDSGAMENTAVETAAMEPVLETEETEIVVKTGYRNKTARLLNKVYIVSLVIMIAYLLFQAIFSIFSYLQQMPTGAAILYTLLGLTMPIILCMFPFLFKFFAEVVELMDKNRN